MQEENVNHKWYHFIGIAGVGMGGLAKILKVSGYKVSGSDLQMNAITEDLISLGATVYIGHLESQVKEGIDTVVISSAIPETNVELIESKRLGLRIISRGELLAEMVNEKKGIAIAGSHGKTTSTAMVYQILLECGIDASFMVGGEIKSTQVRANAGSSDFFVTEADESDGSFLKLKPFAELITNVENDHLDYYGTLDNLINSFADFIENVPIGGFACLGSTSPILQKLSKEAWTRIITFGENITDDYRIDQYQPDGIGSVFTVYGYLENEPIAEIHLQVPGYHNALDALGAFALTSELGCPTASIIKALEEFTGTRRRFEIIGSRNEVAVVDDYAHHPTELKATIKAAREVYVGRIVAMFQPHRYTRTQQMSEDFADVFANADSVIITDVYAAGEKPIPGISGELIYNVVKKHHQEVYYVQDKNTLCDFLDEYLKSGDLLLSLGAGDIGRIARFWMESN